MVKNGEFLRANKMGTNCNISGIVITSNNLRHKYFAKKLSEKFNIKVIISEDKGNYYNKQIKDSEFARKHFYKLDIQEKIIFNSINWPDIDIKCIPKNSINSETIRNEVKELNPELIFLFGSSILNEDWIKEFNGRIINLHLGLSPFYKGSATLFWPIANNEVECLGSTIHIAEKTVDSGRILARIKPSLEIGDNLYTLSYKTIKESIDQYPDICMKYNKGTLKPFIQNNINAKIFKKADFNDENLLKALEYIGDGLTKEKIHQIKASRKCVC